MSCVRVEARTQLIFRLLLVTIRVLRLPAPHVGAHLIHTFLGAPAQLALRPGWIGVRLGDIARAAGHDLVRDRFAARPLEGRHHIQDAVALPGAQVVGCYAGVCASFCTAAM